MKTILLAFVGFLIFALPDAPLSAFAQASLQARRGTSDQGTSHQMNQPPPDSGNRHQLSDATIDEIRQLFLQSQKEPADKPATQKTSP